jgi:hypothetical protein
MQVHVKLGRPSVATACSAAEAIAAHGNGNYDSDQAMPSEEEPSSCAHSRDEHQKNGRNPPLIECRDPWND